MPRAVVTGGAGFIGSHMVDLLVDRGYSVVVIDNLVTGRAENLAQHRREPRVDFHEIDMCTVAADSRLFQDVDYVFHFGGIGDIVPSIERPLEYMRANVDGTLAVLEASRHAGVRKFVYAASSSCYGMATELPTTEGGAHPTRVPLRAQQVPGGERGAALGPGVPAARGLDPHVQRLRAPRAHHRRLRRGVRRLPGPEAPRQAVHGGRRRLPAAGLRVRHRRRPSLPDGRRVHRDRPGLQPGLRAIPRPSTGSSS